MKKQTQFKAKTNPIYSELVEPISERAKLNTKFFKIYLLKKFDSLHQFCKIALFV
jgi:hypothetical protein